MVGWSYGADAGAMFGPVFEALAAGLGAEEAARRLVDGSGRRAGYFDSQPAADRAIQLENARTLPLQLHQPTSRAVTGPDVAALRIPVRFCRGTQTRPLFPIATEAAAAWTPAGGSSLVEGAGHMLPLEDPARFAAEVNAFLSIR